MSDRLRIHAPSVSPRLRYVCDLIFRQLLGLDYEWTKEEHAHLHYAKSVSPSGGVHIPLESDLLFQTGFAPLKVPSSGNGAETRLFPVENTAEPAWDFDLFSAVFYLLSRYEEYSGFTPDAHLRFPPEASILESTQSFEFPLVNLWVQQLKSNIQQRWPDLRIQEPSFQFLSTIDIDSTYQYREKGILWSVSGMMRDLFKGNFKAVSERIKVLLRLKPDAFDVFNKLETLHQQHSVKVIYFFLLGDYGPFDKNISWKSKRQASLIRRLAKDHRIGIHPSYGSNTRAGQLASEIRRLQEIYGQKPELSRQHFLIHHFPKTCQDLLKAGIKEDHTLGYTSRYGFRAGIASPFFFYDLQKEEITDLRLFPFCSMDITPLHYEALNIRQAMEKNRELLERVKAVNGTFISLWHNESLSGTGRWGGGWPEVYEQLLNDANELSR